MVNQVVYDYLKNYSGKYKLEDLKKKILSGGYSESDFNEAASDLGLIKKLPVNEIAPITPKKPPVKLIKVSAIIGSVFIVVLIGLLISLFFLNPIVNIIEKYPDYFDLSVLTSKIIYSSILIVLSVLIILFYLGFYIIGKLINSKQFKIFSLILIIFLVLASCFICFEIITKKPSFRGVPVIDPNNPNPAISFSQLINIAYLRDNQNYFFGVFLLGAIVYFLFYLGLVLIRKQVKYSFLSGILGLVFISDIIIFFCLLYFISSIWNKVLSLSNFGFQFAVVPACFCFLLILVFLFKTILLFSASKRFSSQGFY